MRPGTTAAGSSSISPPLPTKQSSLSPCNGQDRLETEEPEIKKESEKLEHARASSPHPIAPYSTAVQQPSSCGATDPPTSPPPPAQPCTTTVQLTETRQQSSHCTRLDVTEEKTLMRIQNPKKHLGSTIRRETLISPIPPTEATLPKQAYTH